MAKTRRRPNTFTRIIEVPVDDWYVIGDQAIASVQVITTVDHDPSYGSDYDGRRGVSQTSFDHDITIQSVEDPDGASISLDLLTDLQRARIIAVADLMLIDEPVPEQPEDDGDAAYEAYRDREQD